MSSGAFWRSPSIVTIAPPRARDEPACIAGCWPKFRFSRTARTRGSASWSARSRAKVPSVEPSSTKTSSNGVSVERGGGAPVELVDGSPASFSTVTTTEGEGRSTWRTLAPVALPRRTAPTLAGFVLPRPLLGRLGRRCCRASSRRPGRRRRPSASRCSSSRSEQCRRCSWWQARPSTASACARSRSSARVFAGATTLPAWPARCRRSLPRSGRGRRLRRALDVGDQRERRAGSRARAARRLMPLAHGLYSAGVLVGAVSGRARTRRRRGREPILLAVAAADRARRRCCSVDDDRRAASRPRALEAPAIRTRRSLASAWWALRPSSSRAARRAGARSSSSGSWTPHPAVSGLGPGTFGGAMAPGASSARRYTVAPTAKLLGRRRRYSLRPAAAWSRRPRARRSRSRASRSPAPASR